MYCEMMMPRETKLVSHNEECRDCQSFSIKVDGDDGAWNLLRFPLFIIFSKKLSEISKTANASPSNG